MASDLLVVRFTKNLTTILAKRDLLGSSSICYQFIDKMSTGHKRHAEANKAMRLTGGR